MGQVNTTDLRGGHKIEVEGQPFAVVSNEFVKPGKGQSFNRIKLRNLLTGRTIERTFKSGEKVPEADIIETNMRLLYKESDGAVFMDDKSFEQVTIPFSVIGDNQKWLVEDILYGVIFYKGAPISVEPPTFMEMKIAQTSPAVRGDTATGRVMKAATTDNGAEIQIPIFVEEGEVVRIDTRTGDYVSRVS